MVYFMEPASHPTVPLDLVLSNSASISETVSTSLPPESGGRPTPSYGKFSVGRSEPNSVYSVDNILPLLSQARGVSSSNRFSSGVSSVYDVSRNLSVLHQPLQPQNFNHYFYPGFSYAATVGGLSHGFRPYDHRVAPSAAMGASSSGSSRPSAFGALNSETDTNEHVPHQVDAINKGKKTRTNYPDWKVVELNKAFQQARYITGQRRVELALLLQMTEHQVKTWFQNKRANVKNQASSGQGDNSQLINQLRVTSQANRTDQKMNLAPLQGVGSAQTYRLLSERGVEVVNAIAKTPLQALQSMLTKMRDYDTQCLPSTSGFGQHQKSESPVVSFTSHTLTE